MIKLLITGASGLLGRELCREAIKENFEVTGLAYSRAGEKYVKCDLTQEGEVEAIVEKIKPTFIVHAAGERFPDKVESDYDRVRIINIETPRRLARIAKKVGSRIIYISSDYIFDGVERKQFGSDGATNLYFAEDKPNPINKYGQTKYEGELAVLEEDESAFIIRIPVLYGNVERLEESAVTGLLSLFISSAPTSVSNYEKRYPSHVRDIARIICALINVVDKEMDTGSPRTNLPYQWSGKERLTKYEMALAIGKAFALKVDHLKPLDQPAADGVRRPYDVCLDASRLQNLGIDFHTPFEEGIKECLEPVPLSVLAPVEEHADGFNWHELLNDNSFSIPHKVWNNEIIKLGDHLCFVGSRPSRNVYFGRMWCPLLADVVGRGGSQESRRQAKVLAIQDYIRQAVATFDRSTFGEIPKLKSLDLDTIR